MHAAVAEGLTRLRRRELARGIAPGPDLLRAPTKKRIAQAIPAGRDARNLFGGSCERRVRRSKREGPVNRNRA